MLNKTTLKAVICLCFDNDFDVYSISDTIGIESTECKRQVETRLNPITNKKNYGYWKFGMEELETFDTSIILRNLINKIEDKASTIKEVLIHNGGVAIVRVFANIRNFEAPAIYFEHDILDFINYLKAEIDIVIDIEE